MRALAAVLFSVTNAATSPATVPVMGWSTWNTFECNINEKLVQESIEALAASPLVRSGYNYVLIDDCWTLCLDEHKHSCHKAGPRGSDGRIQISPEKFPNGFKPLTELAHSKGLKIGIYTSVSAVTCGGYTGSLHNEAVDAEAFADWGFDFVKHDTCGTDYSVHDGGMQDAVTRMRDGLWEAGGGEIVYYLDSGNPTSPQRVFNPRQIHISDKEAKKKLATKPSELVWVWLGTLPDQEKGPHLFKSWFDIEDTFLSTMTNLHNQVRIAEYQSCGHFNMPDMLTVGQGAQSMGQYRAQFFLWAVLGAPLILGNDIREISEAHLQLLTAPEVLQVNQDSDCIQGSQARDMGSGETWIKPLSDDSFAVVLLNKGAHDAKLRVHFNDDGKGWGQGADFFPADFDRAHVRDLFARKELGAFDDGFSVTVPGNDAMIFKICPGSKPCSSPAPSPVPTPGPVPTPSPTPSPAPSPSGWCTSGIDRVYNGVEVCCAKACGQCGVKSDGCKDFPGGKWNCCADSLAEDGDDCPSPDDTGCKVPHPMQHV